MKGSTCKESYMTNLKLVQSAIRSQQEIVVNLVPERDNPKDTYAIRVVVSVQDRSLPMGCIRVRKIPKITSAILICEIVSVRVKSVTSWLMKNLNVRYVPLFRSVKEGDDCQTVTTTPITPFFNVQISHLSYIDIVMVILRLMQSFCMCNLP